MVRYSKQLFCLIPCCHISDKKKQQQQNTADNKISSENEEGTKQAKKKNNNNNSNVEREYTLFYECRKTHLFTRARKTRHDNIYDLLTHTPFGYCDKKRIVGLKSKHITSHFDEKRRRKLKKEIVDYN